MEKALPPLHSKTITYLVSIFKELDTPGKYHIQIEIERNGVRGSSLVPVCNSGIAIGDDLKELPTNTCHPSIFCRADALRLRARRTRAACGKTVTPVPEARATVAPTVAPMATVEPMAAPTPEATPLLKGAGKTVLA
ncbi:MAG: hypothetical protein V8Q85_03235 [Christensenellales bacterium]